MNLTSMVERLAALPALADIPREQLEWLVDHGEVHRFGDGASFFGESTGFTGLFVLVSGRFSVRIDEDAVVRELREVTPGRFTVFEPFYTTKDVGQGRGLGLDIVRTVVRGHRGAVELSSSPGRTELRVALPIAGAGTGRSASSRG